MAERKEYVMNQEQYDALMEACKPVPLIALHWGPIPSVQERVNSAWEKLGKEMGFKHMTAKPLNPDKKYHFTAEPV